MDHLTYYYVLPDPDCRGCGGTGEMPPPKHGYPPGFPENKSCGCTMRDKLVMDDGHVFLSEDITALMRQAGCHCPEPLLLGYGVLRTHPGWSGIHCRMCSADKPIKAGYP